MGMSASQVRFLSLQHRKHNIGRELTTLSNRKMGLSRDMNRVSKNYTEALNRTKLQWSNNCGNTYSDLSYDLLMRPNDVNCETPYIITDSQGRVVVDNTKFWFDKETSELKYGDDVPAGKGVTYRQLASAISAYSGYDSYNKTTTFYNVDRLGVDSHTIGDIGITRNGETKQLTGIDAKGNTFGLASADGCEYELVSNISNYDFQNSLRYELMIQLGLLGDAEMKTYQTKLTELYGSQDAKDKEFYPVGSAWGDYYIAKANLEAYDDFLKTKQYISSADLYSGTKKTSKTFEYDSSVYSYSSAIDGNTGSAGITQKGDLNQSGSLQHVNFDALVTEKMVDGKAETYAVYKNNVEEDGSITDNSAEFNSYATSAFYDKYAITNNDTNTDVSSTISVSQNGIEYNYAIDDVLTNAIKNFVAGGVSSDGTVDGISDDFTRKVTKALIRGASNDDRKYEFVYEDGGWSRGQRDIDASKTAVADCVDKFVQIMNSSATISGELDETAVKKAKEAVKQLYGNNYEFHSNGTSCSASDDDNNSIDTNMVIFTRRRQHMDWDGWVPEWHDHAITDTIDIMSLYRTFMSFYEYYVANSDATGGTLTVASAQEHPELNTVPQNSSSINPTILGTGTGTPRYSITEITNVNTDGVTFVSRSKTKLTTNTSEAVDTETPLYSYSNGTRYEAEYKFFSADSATKYYQTNESETLVYYQDKGSHGATYNGVPIYGYVDKSNSTSDKRYYFTSTTELNNYITNGTLPPNSVDNQVISATDTFPITMASGNATKPDQDSVVIAIRANATSYDIKMYSKVTEDKDYRQQLEDNVNEAKKRIDKLEDDLKQIFGGFESKFMDYFDVIFKRISQNGWVYDEKVNSSSSPKASQKYLNTMLENNKYYITEARELTGDAKYQYTMKIAQNVQKVYEVHDTNAENQALAEYETAKTLISMKEKKIDARMVKLETEQQAITTELDSLEKVRNDNIEKYFKIFA